MAEVTEPRTRMVVTVGVSLERSASWEAAGPFANVRGYSDRLVPEALGSPEYRGHLPAADEVNGEVRDLLAASGPGDLVDHLAQPPSVQPAMRYSAEIATILLLFEQERQGAETIAGFLERRYDEIVFLTVADDTFDAAFQAGRHLAAIAARLFDFALVSHQRELRGSALRDLVDSLDAYLNRLIARPVDVVVSGGYKAFATTAGRFLPGRPAWRSIYLHEAPRGGLPSLVREDGDGVFYQDGTRSRVGPGRSDA